MPMHDIGEQNTHGTQYKPRLGVVRCGIVVVLCYYYLSCRYLCGSLVVYARLHWVVRSSRGDVICMGKAESLDWMYARDYEGGRVVPFRCLFTCLERRRRVWFDSRSIRYSGFHQWYTMIARTS